MVNIDILPWGFGGGGREYVGSAMNEVGGVENGLIKVWQGKGDFEGEVGRADEC